MRQGVTSVPGDRLDQWLVSRGHAATKSEAQAIFASVGLTGPFWKL